MTYMVIAMTEVDLPDRVLPGDPQQMVGVPIYGVRFIDNLDQVASTVRRMCNYMKGHPGDFENWPVREIQKKVEFQIYECTTSNYGWPTLITPHWTDYA